MLAKTNVCFGSKVRNPINTFFIPCHSIHNKGMLEGKNLKKKYAVCLLGRLECLSISFQSFLKSILKSQNHDKFQEVENFV